MTDWQGTGIPTSSVQVLTPLQEAQADLELWKKALRALASGQMYRLGTRQLTRVNLKECREMVRYYENEVSRLSAGRRRGARVIRPIPTDY